MLRELMVENYAVIERARVEFRPGLNLLTGETGSGKSIIVDALGLLFGGRASQDSVRTGADRARISGVFEIPPDKTLAGLLDSAGIAAEDGELIIEREISAEGKSRAFAANRPITAALLRELAPFLGDIHGQHDQQLLFSADAQLEMLDAFAGTSEACAGLAGVYRDWKAAGRDLEELEKGEQEQIRMLDLWEFQRREIENVAPKPGEDATLEQERRVLQNSSRLQDAANAAYTALYDAPESARTQLGAAIKRLEELRRIDPRLDSVRESLSPAVIAIEEASYAVRDYVSHLEADPERLEEIEERLAALDRLKRKYGPTVAEILAFLDDVRTRIASVENAGERKAELSRERERLAAEFRGAAASLSARRKSAAASLEKAVENELASLAMPGTKFQVAIADAQWSESGADTVRFLISPNLGEEPRPIEKVASGGELSRIALAVKTCIAAPADKNHAAVERTLVFDEVDAGIGGRAADTVGRRLKQLASSHQVLCVTHLPQIAVFADQHFYVEKTETGGRTSAVVAELKGEARTREVARMLSGDHLTREALKHAEQLIRIGAEAAV